jgi:hypothetical protein
MVSYAKTTVVWTSISQIYIKGIVDFISNHHITPRKFFCIMENNIIEKYIAEMQKLLQKFL